MIDIHQKARANFNKKGSEYLEKVEKIPLDSISIRYPNLTENLTVKAKSEYVYTPNIGIFKKHDNQWVGVNPKIGKEIISNLVNGIYRIKSINETCTFEFIRNQIYIWLISSKIGQITKPLIDYLIEEISPLINEYQYFFRIKNLKTDSEFQIGEVLFLNFNDRFVKNKIDKTIKEEQKGKFRETLFKAFMGSCICTITVKGVTEGKGLEIALKKCQLSTNILKILSPYFQEHTFDPCNFDIEHFLLEEEVKSTLIFSNPNSSNNKNIRLAMSKPPIQVYHIDIFRFENMKALRLHEFSNFLLKPTTSKLEYLINQFILLLGEAISEKDFHNKIVKYCSIMDVIFLKKGNASIIDSIRKYFPPIVTNKNSSQELKNTIPEIYKIRSKKIHHNIEDDFELKHLGIIQYHLFLLLLNLVLLSKNYSDINEIFSKIDSKLEEAINSVFIHE